MSTKKSKKRTSPHSSVASLNHHVARLQNFIDSIRALDESDISTEQAVKSLMGKYRDLYEHFVKLDKKEIALFSTDQIRAIELLRLGKENHKSFEKVLKLISSSGLSGEKDLARVAVEYLKTNAAFAEINGNTKNLSSEQVAIIFRTLFGVQVASDVAMCFKAELLGSAVGYAISGLAEKDIAEWNALPEEKREPIQDYLYERILKSDVKLHVSVIQDGLYSCSVDPHSSRITAKGAVREGGVADHLFINTDREVLYVGSSTSNADSGWQGRTAIDNYIAAVLMTRHEKNDDGTDNPYYGFKVEPFYFSTGRMASNGFEDISSLNSKAAKKIAAIGSREFLRDVGQMALLSVMGNLSSVEDAIVFMAHDIIISGTDTMDLRDIREDILANPDVINGSVSLNDPIKKRISDRIRSTMVQKMVNVLEVMTAANMNVKNEDSVFFKNICSDIAKMSKAIPICFKDKMTQKEFDSEFAPLHHAMVAFENRYKDTVHDKLILNQIPKMIYKDSRIFAAMQSESLNTSTHLESLPPKNYKKEVFVPYVQVTQDTLNLTSTIGLELYRSLSENIEKKKYRYQLKGEDSVTRLLGMLEDTTVHKKSLSSVEKKYGVTAQSASSSANLMLEGRLKYDYGPRVNAGFKALKDIVAVAPAILNYAKKGLTNKQEERIKKAFNSDVTKEVRQSIKRENAEKAKEEHKGQNVVIKVGRAPHKKK